MTEKAPSFEQQETVPDRPEAGHETHEVSEAAKKQIEQDIQSRAETAANVEAEQAKKAEKLRGEIKDIHEPKAERDEFAQSASRIIRVPLERLEPVVDTIAKTWTSIRQNLSPTQKTFSKVIHNPIVSVVSEFTAKTLARPYAILSGSIAAVIGSGFYLYLTRHMGYHYNYFVPLMLFAAGLGIGIIAEAVYEFIYAHHRSK